MVLHDIKNKVHLFLHGHIHTILHQKLSTFRDIYVKEYSTCIEWCK